MTQQTKQTIVSVAILLVSGFLFLMGAPEGNWATAQFIVGSFLAGCFFGAAFRDL